jgi:hypothetical protein
MLHAAATALHLAAEGRITARGRLASAAQPPLHQHVYDGDRPDPSPACGQVSLLTADRCNRLSL